MENQIKITVKYETPDTSKLDSLLAQYQAAKQMADAQKTYNAPLIQCAASEKYDCILDTLEALADKALQFAVMAKNSFTVYAHYGQIDYKISMNFSKDGTYQISYLSGSNFFNKSEVIERCTRISSPHPLLTKWEDYQIAEQFERSIENHIKWYINSELKTKQQSNDILQDLCR